MTFADVHYILVKMAKIDWSKHNYHNDTTIQTQLDRDSEAHLRDVERSRLRFGKHKGKTLKQVPINYLKWIVSTWQPNSKFAKATINNAKHEITQRQHSTQVQRTKVENPN